MYQMRDRDDLYLEYLRCYNKGKDLRKLRSESETFQVLSLKQGYPVKYISTKDVLSLPVDDQLIGADGFYRRHKGFYLIPNEFEGRILSFVIRGLTHDYHDVPCMSYVRPLFGWYMFEKFKKNDTIIITEGTKDCIILQQYYPYVLALLTAGITVSNMNILKSMTNKIILAYDRDSTGLGQTKKDVELLKSNGIQVQFIKPKLKDFGKEYKNSTYLKEEIPNVMRKFSRLGAILCQ